MTAAILNFDKENSIEIGASFNATIKLCDAPNLLDYQGVCQFKVAEDDLNPIISAIVTITNHDTFNLSIPHTSFNSIFVAGSYKYDVLFFKSNDRFYAIRGVGNFIKTISKIS